MTDGIGRLSGYGNYSVGPYVPQRKRNDVEGQEAQAQAQPQQNRQETQFDPDKVMEFLNANNVFVAQPAPVVGVETDPTIAGRVAGYMDNFELFFSVLEQEFGPEMAAKIMDSDVFMDKLMGMVD